MKTKIQILISSFLLLASAHAAAPWLVDTTTPSIVNGLTVYGDVNPVPFNKANSNTIYFVAQLATNNLKTMAVSNTTAQLATSVTVLSNKLGYVTNTLAVTTAAHAALILSNSLAIIEVSNRVANFDGSNIVSGTVNSNALDYATLGWLQALSATMNFDGGKITSDGWGNLTTTEAIYASYIKAGLYDMSYGTGGLGYYPRANGDGTWNWAAWPAVLNFDSGTLTSDGGGNVAGTSWRGGLLDNGYSSGTAGYAPLANGDGTWTWGVVAGGGGGGGPVITNFIFTATNLPAGSAATVVVTGVTNGIAYVFQGIPAAAPNTNTITAYNFTNQVLSSRQIPVYTTNYAFWDVASHGSNFLGRFAGVVDWRLNGGDDAGNPPIPMPVKLMASFSGSNSWFELTNSFVTQSNISLSIVTNGPSQSGGHQVNGGYCTIYTLDHWELYKKDNVFDYQTLRRNTPPVDGADLVTKSYVDAAIAFAINSAFNLGTDSQGISHYKYSVMGSEVVDLVGVFKSVQITGCVSDGLGNVVLSIPVTNLVAGWQLQTTTNIALGGPGFTTFTNYAAVTNTGVLNLTVAMTQPQLFFRGIRIYGVAMKIGSNLPVDHSTNSTFGMGAGLIVQSQIGGTNYIVFSTGTNAWGRVAVPTNTW